MIIRILWLLAILGVGLVFGPYVQGDKGYVLVSMGPHTIETSVVSALIMLTFGIIVLFALEILLKWGFRFGKQPFSWLSGRGAKKQQKAFRSGLLALELRDYDKAKSDLETLRGEDFSGIDLLACAQAAWFSGEEQQAMDLWQKASKLDESMLPATLHLVRVHSQNAAYGVALQLLDGLPEAQQKVPQVIQQRAEILAKSNQWRVLQKQLKGWKSALGPDLHQQYEGQMLSRILAEVASKDGALALQAHWQKLPRKVKNDTQYRRVYIQQLLSQDMHPEAQQALVDWQKSEPEAAFLPLYSQLRLKSPTAVQKQLESWLKKTPEEPELLSALGHVAFYASDYSLAEKALSKALTLRVKEQDQRVLAQIKESQGQSEVALNLYKGLLRESLAS